MLASLSMLALGIFGPGIATGLVSGGPSLEPVRWPEQRWGRRRCHWRRGGCWRRQRRGCRARMAPGAACLAAGRAAPRRLSMLAHGRRQWHPGARWRGQRGQDRRSRRRTLDEASAAAAFRPDEAPASGADAADAPPSNEQPAWAKRLHRRQQLTHAATTAAHTLRRRRRQLQPAFVIPIHKENSHAIQTTAGALRRYAAACHPYQSAAQVWDDRIGSARVQAKNWRLMAFGCLTLGC